MDRISYLAALAEIGRLFASLVMSQHRSAAQVSIDLGQ
jgi:hypothetical protein